MVIAFFGLGAMGLPMARNLIKASHRLHIVQHRSRKPVEELAGMGAVVHEKAYDAVKQADVIVSILPADKEMEQLLLDPAVLSSINPEATLIEMTSGSPQMMKQVAAAYTARGIRVLDAPVSGGTAGAEQGTLTLMIGGKQEDFDHVKPVAEAMGKNFFFVGGYGAGKAVKSINQLLAGIHMLAASEAIAIAQNLGVDLDKLNDVIGKSSGSSWMFNAKLKAVSESRFAPGFRLNLMKKDVGIAIKEGEGIPLPLSTLAYQLYEIAALQDGDSDFSAVSRLIRKSIERMEQPS